MCIWYSNGTNELDAISLRQIDDRAGKVIAPIVMEF